LTERPPATFAHTPARLRRCDLDAIPGRVEHNKDGDKKKEEETAGQRFRDLQSGLLRQYGQTLFHLRLRAPHIPRGLLGARHDGYHRHNASG
jgi:hypothetical protein